MTAHRKKAAEPGTARQPATPSTLEFRLSEEDRRELWDPDDLLRPDYPDRNWLPGPPTCVIVLAEARCQGRDRPWSLVEFLENGNIRAHDPEPDLEAEP
jgi:hypothetical protein